MLRALRIPRPLRPVVTLAAFCAAALLSFCASPPRSVPGSLPADAGEFLFEVESVNFAWGARQAGAYVDREGVVWSYRVDAPRPAEEREEREAWTAEELRAKYAQNRERIATVPPEEVARMAALVADAADGPLGEPVQRCNDAGVVSFRAWRYDASSDLYRPVLLRAEGDRARANRSDAAETLVGWLRTTTGERGVPPCAP